LNEKLPPFRNNRIVLKKFQKDFQILIQSKKLYILKF